MIITNKNNLPQAYVDAVKETHKPVDKQYSVTTILKPIREIMLMRRHYDEIEQDVSDMVWLIFGSAVHKIIEEADKTGYAEYELLEKVIDDYYLSGICDLYNEEDFSVEDHKTASVTKVIKGDFNDWKAQGLAYAWMLRKRGKYVGKLKFHALLKDWSPRDYRNRGDKFYPEHPIWTWYYDISEQDIINIEEDIKYKFKNLIVAETLPDDELPVCTMEERWNSGDKYRVIKPGAKKALKICDNIEEASILANGNNALIETIKGEDKKCKDYCLVCKFCKYWKENVNGKTN